MQYSLNIGEYISLDSAIDERMIDQYELVIYRSEKDEGNDCFHIILLTIWNDGAMVRHNYCYAVDSDGCVETQETASDANVLVEELPAECQAQAQACIDNWSNAFLVAGEEKLS